MAEHDPKKLVQSEVFRALNLLIDQKVERLKADMEYVLTDAIPKTRKYKWQPSITTRVSYEEGEDREVPLPFEPMDVDQIISSCHAIKRLSEEIGSLQRFKLRLLNDYDFTHGENDEQIHVFGDPEAKT